MLALKKRRFDPFRETIMLHPVKTFGERVSLAITIIGILGITLNFWGIVFNGIVVIANDDVMPVMTEASNVSPDQPGTKRQAMTEGNLMLLSDRFLIDFPSIDEQIPNGYPGKATRWWAKYTLYPTDGGKYFVSIGDVMRWTGTILFLLLVPLVITLIPFQISSALRSGRNWRGR